MIFFLAGVLAVQAAVFGVGYFAAHDDERDTSGLLLELVLAPMMLAVSTGLLVHTFSPRRLFDRRVRRPLSCLLRGTLAGMVGTGLAGAGIAFAPDSVHDIVITAAAGALGVVAVLLGAARVRPGRCIHCDYDLRATPPDAPCPECGERGGR